MQSFEIAFASLLLLVSIVYFLPIGLTCIGKILSILIAFSIAMLGILANSFLPLWEIALLLGSLLFVISYMINKKLNGLFFLSMVTESSDQNGDEIEESLLLHSDELSEFEIENVEESKESSFSLTDEEKSIPKEESLQIFKEELDEITPISFLQYFEDELSNTKTNLQKNPEPEREPESFVLSDLEKILEEDAFSTDFETENEVQKTSLPVLKQSEDLLEPVNFEAFEEANSPEIYETKDYKQEVIRKNWLEELDELEGLEGLDGLVDNLSEQFHSLTSNENGDTGYLTDIELEDEITTDTDSNLSSDNEITNGTFKRKKAQNQNL